MSHNFALMHNSVIDCKYWQSEIFIFLCTSGIEDNAYFEPKPSKATYYFQNWSHFLILGRVHERHVQCKPFRTNFQLKLCLHRVKRAKRIGKYFLDSISQLGSFTAEKSP